MLLKASLMVFSIFVCMGLFILVNIALASLGTKVQNHLPNLYNRGENTHE